MLTDPTVLHDLDRLAARALAPLPNGITPLAEVLEDHEAELAARIWGDEASEAGQAGEYQAGRRCRDVVEPGLDYQKSEPVEATTPRPALDSQPCAGGRDLAKLCDE